MNEREILEDVSVGGSLRTPRDINVINMGFLLMWGVVA